MVTPMIGRELDWGSESLCDRRALSLFLHLIEPVPTPPTITPPAEKEKEAKQLPLYLLYLHSTRHKVGRRTPFAADSLKRRHRRSEMRLSFFLLALAAASASAVSFYEVVNDEWDAWKAYHGEETDAGKSERTLQYVLQYYLHSSSTVECAYVAQ